MNVHALAGNVAILDFRFLVKTLFLLWLNSFIGLMWFVNALLGCFLVVFSVWGVYSLFV